MGRDDADGAARRRLGAVRELGTVMSAALVYFGVRLLAHADTHTATANADHILSLERALRVDVESRLQAVVSNTGRWR